MLTLTARQQQVLDLIRVTIEQSGFPPTRAEIAQQLGFASANAAEEHLRALARKGAIEMTPGASRGLRLINAGRKPHQFTLPSAGMMQLTLPLIGRVAAGQPILATENIVKNYQVDPALFTSTPDYLLRVRGMSMRDAGILDGDLLAVQRVTEARNGQIVVARLGDEVTVKRLRKKGKIAELIAENPAFDNLVVDLSRDDCVIEGVAVGLVREGSL